MNWTKESKPSEHIRYNHICCTTPLGVLSIEWKGWKERPNYDIMLDTGDWIGSEYTLDKAKEAAEQYMDDLIDKLIEFRNR